MRNLETIDLVGPYGLRLLCLRQRVWGDADATELIMRMKPGFDCFVVNFAEPPEDAGNALIAAIVRQVGGWVEVFGDQAETIHDAIDSASVSLGRQAVVGEGSPMTTWQEETRESDIASYIWTGGQGESLRKVVVLVGQPQVTEPLMEALLGHRHGPEHK